MNEKTPYELFDHTADLGVRAFATNLQELFENAARGLYGAIGQLIPADETDAVAGVERHSDSHPQREHMQLKCDAGEHALLLRDFLTELLIWFETEDRMMAHITWTRLDETNLDATVTLASLDLSRSELHREVKAVTYHELSVIEQDGLLVASYIVDI
ncbi:MAG: archease [Phycisphaerae bacterium]